MSLWTEKTDAGNAPAGGEMSDVCFRITCERLPVDHAQSLSNAVLTEVPWLADLPQSGVHQIHVAGSQNGWERPDDDPQNELMLSKRTRLKIRINTNRIDELVAALVGKSLSLGKYSLEILSGEPRDLKVTSTLISRYTCFHSLLSSPDNEERFIDAVISWCSDLGYQPTRLLCGKRHQIITDDFLLISRSLLIADVPEDFSLVLQDAGIGDWRTLGCGIAIPHKDTGSVY